MKFPENKFGWRESFMQIVSFSRKFAYLLLLIIVYSNQNDTASSQENPTVVPVDPAAMVSIKGGSFMMGDVFGNGRKDRELPVHEVELQDFRMMRYEVSWDLWTKVRTWAVSNGYDIAKGRMGWGKKTDGGHPVTFINWYECVKWCNAYSEMNGLKPCYYMDAAHSTVYRKGKIEIEIDWVLWDADGYRLPTEAEWEYAARERGRKVRYGDGTDSATRESMNIHNLVTMPVGSYRPNALGLFDMSGNTYEWCFDWYAAYPSTVQKNPRGPASGTRRIMRSGCHYRPAYNARTTNRWHAPPGGARQYIGFRAVIGKP